MRFFCDIEGLENNWFDFADKWTRGEVKRVESGQWQDDEEFFSFLAGKVEECHIEDETGNVAESVEALTDEFLDNCDARLTGFVASAPFFAVRELQRLGNWSARLQSATAEATKK